MKYVVSRDLIQQFVMMNIDAMDLFPDDAPSGTSFYELIPEKGEPVVITYEDALNKSAGIVYSLDEEKEGKDEINFERIDEIISRYNL